MYQKTASLPATKRIALVAHDNQKKALADWVNTHRKRLSHHRLYATGTTGHLLTQTTGLDVHSMLSGPLGGDQQLGAMITTGDIDLLIFFWDPFEPLPHDPDVKALLRVAAVWNIAVASTRTSADFLLASALLDQEHPRQIPDYDRYLAARIKEQ